MQERIYCFLRWGPQLLNLSYQSSFPRLLHYIGTMTGEVESPRTLSASLGART